MPRWEAHAEGKSVAPWNQLHILECRNDHRSDDVSNADTWKRFVIHTFRTRRYKYWGFDLGLWALNLGRDLSNLGGRLC